MVTPGRSFSAGNQYRYGFNGKENDPSISAGAQDYGMRISDVRLGKFLSVDPLSGKFPMLTPYQFASNTPVQAIDLDGREAEYFASRDLVKAHGVAALSVIDYHHGMGELLKATYSIHVEGNLESFQRLKTAYTTDPGILHNPNNQWAK